MVENGRAQGKGLRVSGSVQLLSSLFKRALGSTRRRDPIIHSILCNPYIVLVYTPYSSLAPINQQGSLLSLPGSLNC